MTAEIDVRIQSEPIDIARESSRLVDGGGADGALVTFTGLCRDEGGRLAALVIEHYPGMAEDEIRRITEEAVRRWPVRRITVIHRHGRVVPGETIVFVAAAGRHRAEAFDAAGFLMDYLKTGAPFWKKEEGPDGGWVGARDADDAARERWG